MSSTQTSSTPKSASTLPGSRSATPGKASSNPTSLVVRWLVTAALVVGFFYATAHAGDIANDVLGGKLSRNHVKVGIVTLLGILGGVVWWKQIKADPRFHAPILITYILAVGDAQYGILDNYHSDWLKNLTGGRLSEISPTFVAILASVLAELALGRFVYGKWPHLASAYISGISVGILVKSPDLWPYVMCALISIVSKYALRVRGRHLWNPSNFGITVLLLLAGNSLSSLSVQSGNDFYPVLLIWVLGGLIMYRLGRWHIPLTFVAAFIPLAFFRSWATGQELNWISPNIWGLHWLRIPITPDLAPITWPMFQLYIFFMITDPKTTTHGRLRQCAVVVLVAIVETALRLGFRDVHSLYHALFIVAPITNLAEILWDGRQAALKKKEVLLPASAG